MPIIEQDSELLVEDLETMDLSKLDEDTQIDIVLMQLDTLAHDMEARGIDPEVIDAALFSAFVSRLQERGIVRHLTVTLRKPRKTTGPRLYYTDDSVLCSTA